MIIKIKCSDIRLTSSLHMRLLILLPLLTAAYPYQDNADMNIQRDMNQDPLLFLREDSLYSPPAKRSEAYEDSEQDSSMSEPVEVEKRQEKAEDDGFNYMDEALFFNDNTNEWVHASNPDMKGAAEEALKFVLEREKKEGKTAGKSGTSAKTTPAAKKATPAKEEDEKKFVALEDDE